MKKIVVKSQTTIRHSGSHIVATTRVTSGNKSKTATKRVPVK